MPAPSSSGSVRELLQVAGPLVVASASTAIKLFTDRLMLTQDSGQALQASFPAGLTWFMLVILFFATAGYAQTFVAQLTGAGRERESGLAVWQGIWVALIGGLVIATGALWAEPLFRFIGHPKLVQQYEVAYFQTLAPGAVFTLLLNALITFWNGRGVTSFQLAIGLGTAALNVPFNWILIFGHLGFPALGIVGAGYGTIACDALGALVALVFFLRQRHRQEYGTWPQRTFVPSQFRNLLSFGLPSGVQTFLDLASFNVFLLLQGLVSTAGVAKERTMEAANLVFNVDSIAWHPVLGLGQAVAILVGQAVGRGDLPSARRCVANARLLAMAYMVGLASLWVLWPDPILALHARERDPGQAQAFALARQMLCFAAGWKAFDALWLVHYFALQGAGDTRFSLVLGMLLAWFGLALPCLGAYWLGADIWALWWILLLYVSLGSCLFLWRYHAGHWQRMRVID